MPLATRVTTALEARLSPAGTRRPTLLERWTVRRLPWRTLVALNAWLNGLGKLATGLYCALLASFLLGLDLRPAVQGALNSGRRIDHVLTLVLVLTTALFLLARSALGWARWKVQRELWRRDVERLGGDA